MPNNENPAVTSRRVPRVWNGPLTHENHSLATYRAQRLTGVYYVRPELADLLSSAIFGEHGHD